MRSPLSSLLGLAGVVVVLSCSSGEPTANHSPSLANSTVASNPASLTADGASTATVTVQLRDGTGAPVTTSGGTVQLQTTGGALGAVTDNHNGSYTATLTAPTATGSGIVSAQLNGSGLTSTATVNFVAGAVDLTHSTLTVADSVLVADGTTSTVMTVRARDAHDNPITSALTVAAASTKGTVSAVASGSAGVYTATLTSPTIAATGTVSAQINSQPLTATASVRFAAGAVSLSHSTITVADSVLIASGAATTVVTVRALDVHDNPVSGAIGEVTIAATSGAVSTVASGAGGVYTATLTSSTALVTSSISAKVNALSLTSTTSVRFKAGPPAAIALTAGNGQVGSVLNSLAAPITVTVSDGFGHPTAGSTVVFTATAGGGSVTGGSVVTDAAGQASIASWTMGAAFGVDTLTATAHVTNAASAVVGTAKAGAIAHLLHYAQSYDGNHAVATIAWQFTVHYQIYLADENNVFFTSMMYLYSSNDASCTNAGSNLTCPLGTLTANVVFQPGVFNGVSNPSFQGTLALPLDAPPRITFWSDRTGGNEIFAMFPDGSGVVQLTNDGYDDLEPVWSPDRRKIAWYSTRNNASNHVDIWTMNADGTGAFQVTTSTSDAHPSWSPDGTKLAFQCVPGASYEICTSNADGTNIQQITSTPSNEFDPEWSPDGLHLIFDSWVSGTQQVGVMSPTGTGRSDLTNVGANHVGNWSPDGTKIVFTSTRDGNDEIYVMNADGSGQTRLTNDASDDDMATWSPSGTKIIFSSNRTGTYQVYTMNANGTGVVRLTNNTANDKSPNWH